MIFLNLLWLLSLTVKFILKDGNANVNLRDNFNSSSLLLASMNGQVGIVKLLLGKVIVANEILKTNHQ